MNKIIGIIIFSGLAVLLAIIILFIYICVRIDKINNEEFKCQDDDIDNDE